MGVVGSVLLNGPNGLGGFGMRAFGLIAVLLISTLSPFVAAGSSDSILSRMNLELSYANDRSITLEVEGAMQSEGKLVDKWLDGEILVRSADGKTVHEETFSLKSGSSQLLTIPLIEEVGLYEFSIVLEADGVRSRRQEGAAFVVYPPEWYAAGFVDNGGRFVVQAGENAELEIQEWVDYGTANLAPGRLLVVGNNSSLELETPLGEPGVIGVRYDVADQWGWTNHENAREGELRGPPHSYIDTASGWADPFGPWKSGEKVTLLAVFAALGAALFLFKPQPRRGD